ncbi:MAG: class I SAM-dependent methyltransferase [Actinomycetota bacterium]|nr:class I SAM-dependent methyltransferase [Actinomycetota bacterium]
MSAPEQCAACGSTELRSHLVVSGEIGPDGLIPSTDRYGTALGDIVRCRHCGHRQLHPMPDESLLAQAYAVAESEAYVEEEAGQRETARRALQRIERHVPGGGALLDLGCWVGFLLAEARDRGWRTTGVEPSEFASGYARERLGLDVRSADLLAADLPSRAFAAVTMGDVIEHLIVPADALARIRELLLPGGVLWLTLPDAGSPLARALGRRWWSVLPTHVQYFTRGSISELLSRGGFDVLEVGTAPKAFTVRYYLERIGGYSAATARTLVRAADAAGVADRIWAPDLRDRMAVIARARS